MLAFETEAKLDDLALTSCEQTERSGELFLLHDLSDGFQRHHCGLVLDEVAQMCVAFVADGVLQAHRVLTHLDDVAHPLRSDVHRDGDLLRRGLRVHLLTQLSLHAEELVHDLDHVRRQANGARLVGKPARDALADPPGSVGRELETTPVIKLLDGAHQAEVALLDEIQEWHAAAQVSLGDADHQAQVGLDQSVLGLHVVALDALGKRHLLGAREQ